MVTREVKCPTCGRTSKTAEFDRHNKPNGKAERKYRIEEEMGRVLTQLDPDSEREGVQDTPPRVAKMWVDELTSGYQTDIPSLLRTFPADDYDGAVIVKDIPLTSTCEHHLVPFVGYAHVGYFPSERVVGLSKIPRLVNAYAKRLQIQERLTGQIADALDEYLDPRGVIVVVSAEHLCMTIRGVQAPGTRTVTSAVRGMFKDNEDGEKEEFLRLIGL